MNTLNFETKFFRGFVIPGIIAEVVMILVVPIQVGGKVGFVNWELGEVIVKPEYDKYAGPLSCRTPYNCVEKDGLWGVLCYDGKLETPIAHSKFVTMMIRDNLNMRVRIELAEDPEQHVT